MSKPSHSFKDRTARMVTYGFLLAFLVYSMFPLGWMLATSFKPEDQTKEYPPRLIPKTFTLDNYQRVLTQTLMPRFVLNSLILSGGTVIAVLGLASLAGYGFSRYHLGTASLVEGSASLSSSTLGAGSHVITATYSGDSKRASGSRAD